MYLTPAWSATAATGDKKNFNIAGTEHGKRITRRESVDALGRCLDNRSASAVGHLTSSGCMKAGRQSTEHRLPACPTHQRPSGTPSGWSVFHPQGARAPRTTAAAAARTSTA